MGLFPSHSLTRAYVFIVPLEKLTNPLQVPDKPSTAVEEQRSIADKMILQRLQDVRFRFSDACAIRV